MQVNHQHYYYAVTVSVLLYIGKRMIIYTLRSNGTIIKCEISKAYVSTSFATFLFGLPYIGRIHISAFGFTIYCSIFHYIAPFSIKVKNILWKVV